jgi:hypothetical protein
MMLTNIFNINGAGGTPIVSGGATYNVTMNEVDLTDGSWTLFDPDDLVDTITFSAGFNTITWNVLAAGSVDYVWDAGGNHRAPRWYKELVLDGTTVQNDKFLAFTSVIQNDPTVNDFNQEAVCGVCISPNTTDLFTVDGSGGFFSKGTGSNPAYGTWQYASSSSTVGLNNVRGVGTVLRGGLALGSGVYHAINSSDETLTAGSRNGGLFNITASAQDSYIMVGFGAKSSADTITAGDQQRISFKYYAVSYNI